MRRRVTLDRRSASKQHWTSEILMHKPRCCRDHATVFALRKNNFANALFAIPLASSIKKAREVHSGLI